MPRRTLAFCPGTANGDRGRNAGFPAPPAQIRTYSFPVYGSYLGCMAKKRTLGYSCKILGLGNQ